MQASKILRKFPLVQFTKTLYRAKLHRSIQFLILNTFNWSSVVTAATARHVAIRNTYANWVHNFLEVQLFSVSAEVSITAHGSKMQQPAVSEHSAHTERNS